MEYANIPGGTKLSEERRANGADQPFGIKMWCLGNEMDGPWQTGHKSAEDYGTLAASVRQVCAPSIRTLNWWSVVHPAT